MCGDSLKRTGGQDHLVSVPFNSLHCNSGHQSDLYHHPPPDPVVGTQIGYACNLFFTSSPTGYIALTNGVVDRTKKIAVIVPF